METLKDRIVEHATVLFAKKGCKTLTMDDIATSLGMSKRTIYENFDNKNELIQACLIYFFEQGELKMQQVLKSSDNVLDAMFQQMQSSTKQLEQIKFNFFNEIRKYYPTVYDSIIKVYKEKNLQGTVGFLQKGQKDGVLRKEVDAKIASVLIHETSTMIMTGDMFADYDIDKKDLMLTLMYNLTRGMCTDKGMKILDGYVEKHKK